MDFKTPVAGVIKVGMASALATIAIRLVRAFTVFLGCLSNVNVPLKAKSLE
ncbi:hypothetical protein GCM10027423_53820 [Spirosoma arcticum]